MAAGESLGTEQKGQPGGGSSVRRWSKEGTRLGITDRGSKGTVGLPKAAEWSRCLPATCSFDHVPLGGPRWEVAALLIQPPHPALAFCTAHCFPWIVFLLPAIFQYCLCHRLLPNASFLLAPQLVPPGPTLQNRPVGELPHRSARKKNRNPCQFCISRIISYVAHLCVVLDFLLLCLFTVLCVFQINLLGFFTIKNVVSLKH